MVPWPKRGHQGLIVMLRCGAPIHGKINQALLVLPTLLLPCFLTIQVRHCTPEGPHTGWQLVRFVRIHISFGATLSSIGPVLLPRTRVCFDKGLDLRGVPIADHR